MFLNCPHCQSLIAVDATTGAVPEYCPYCDGAILAVGEQLEADSAATHTAVPTSDATHDATAQADRAADDPNGETITDNTADAGQTSESDAPPARPTPISAERKKTPHPSFARRRAASEKALQNARWPWPLAAGLMLLLVLQLIVADRASLAANPRWRAAMIHGCQVLHCDIPPWREAGAFTMLTREVRAHPDAADALRVHAAFRNDARWPQPWPELVLTLSDASGRVTGSRSFTAAEYLGDTPTQKLIATGQTASFALEIVEPAPETVSFSFDFR